MKRLTVIVAGCVLLASNAVLNANAQNSSLLRAQASRVQPGPQGGLPGMNASATQAQFIGQQVPPAPQIVPNQSNGDPSGRPPSVMPPEQMPPLIPARPNAPMPYLPDVTPPIGLAV